MLNPKQHKSLAAGSLVAATVGIAAGLWLQPDMSKSAARLGPRLTFATPSPKAKRPSTAPASPSEILVDAPQNQTPAAQPAVLKAPRAAPHWTIEPDHVGAPPQQSDEQNYEEALAAASDTPRRYDASVRREYGPDLEDRRFEDGPDAWAGEDADTDGDPGDAN
jgi:hypothetical protein